MRLSYKNFVARDINLYNLLSKKLTPDWKGRREFFEVREVVCILIVVVTQLYILVKTHSIVHLKYWIIANSYTSIMSILKGLTLRGIVEE